MIKQNQKILNTVNLLVDVLLIILSYFISIEFRFTVLNGIHSVNLKTWDYLFLLMGYCLITITGYYLFQIYAANRYLHIGKKILIILVTNLCSTLILIAVLFALKLLQFSRVLLVIFYLCSSLLVIIKHVLIHVLQNFFRKKGYNLQHVILVGDGQLAQQYARSISENHYLGFCIDGYIGNPNEELPGKYLGGMNQIDTLLPGAQADEIVIALNNDQLLLMDSIIAAAYRSGIRVRVIPYYNQYIPDNPSIDSIESVRLINLNATPLDNLWNRFIKRIFDIVMSLLGLILLSPLMLITAICIKVTSPGPVFFKQERVGKDQKIFKMLKFRSMRVNNSQDNGWSTSVDSRRTRFGSLIRKTSIDELPQLMNVFAGQMSLVGPRPEVPFHVEHFREEIPRYLVRQQVRPGITGWAQINGLRGDTDIGKRVEYDLWYINNWSARLDMKILIRTLFGGFYNNETMINK